MTRHRSVEQLVEEQARRWRLRQAEHPATGRRPLITLSHQHGTGGREIARRLGEALDLDVFDRTIIQRIAEGAQLSEHAVEPLDERDRAVIDEWLAPFATERYLTHYDYRHHLVRVVAAIARRGGAIVVGRGGHLLLRPGEALRVRLVAPLAARVRVVSEREGVSEGDARERVEAADSERRAFIRRYFHTELDDPTRFDLVLNTDVLGPEGAVAAIRAAFASLPALRARTVASRDLPPSASP